MPNPILEQIRSNSGTTPPAMAATQSPTDTYIQNLQQLAQLAKGNPNSLQNLIMQNPNLKQAMSLMKNPEQAITMLANQRGLNPTQIIQAIKNLNNRA